MEEPTPTPLAKIVGDLREYLVGGSICAVRFNGADVNLSFELVEGREGVGTLECSASGDIEVVRNGSNTLTEEELLNRPPRIHKDALGDELYTVYLGKLGMLLDSRITELSCDGSKVMITCEHGRIDLGFNNMSDIGVTFGSEVGSPYAPNDVMFFFFSDRVLARVGEEFRVATYGPESV